MSSTDAATEAKTSTEAAAAGGKRDSTKIQGDRVIFNDMYEILLSHPVHGFEHPYADVYEAIQKENKTQSLLAYVIKDHYPARLDIIQSFLNRETNGFSTIKHVGAANWDNQTQRMVVLMTKPQAPSLLSVNSPKRTPISEEALRKYIIKPIFNGLNALSPLGYGHGNIRADNIFWSQRENEEAVTGDFVTSLCGALQSTVYETVERAMTHPLAKGEASFSDDVYALGVLAAILLRGYDPLAGKPDQFIIDEKINRTSFTVLTDGLQLTPRMSDFFRTTLSDDPRLRWTIDQLENWVNGNRAPLKQHATLKKATRALDFNGRKYMRARAVAHDLYDNPAEALQLIESGNLIKWLDRSLIDTEMIEAVNNGINRASANGKNGSYQDRLLCYVAMALDPSGPIRYKDVRAMPHGLGGILLDLIIREQPVQAVAEIIREKIAWYKITSDHYMISKENEWLKKYDQLSKFILRRSMDCGLERCLYEIAEFCPCLSPLLQKFYVLNCANVLQALDKIGQENDRPQVMVDRHIVAFIAARDPKDYSAQMALLESEDARKRAISLMALLQNLQQRYQVPQLKGLTTWLIKEAEIVAQRFQNLKHRAAVIKSLQSDAKSGNVLHLLNRVDGSLEVTRDRVNFYKSVQYYRQLRDEQVRLSGHLQTNTVFGRETGRQIAAIVSAVLAAFFIVLTVMTRFFERGSDLFS